MNQLYNYFIGNNVANYVKFLGYLGGGRILRGIGKSHELDRVTKTQRKVLWIMRRTFFGRVMGTLASQSDVLFEISLAQGIYTIVNCRSTSILNG